LSHPKLNGYHHPSICATTDLGLIHQLIVFMPQILSPDEFFNAPGIILDVRSPAEYAHGHIPGAVSFPLFSDDERAQVGTCYKQQGKDLAIELGLTIVGSKLTQFVQTAKKLSPDHPIRLHCWRGGMRSSSMAWLLETAGMQVSLLEGGHKAFRQWVRSTLATPQAIVTLGGMTGTGKTILLNALAERGEQILDLEHLANHRGSSYGSLGLPPQPSNEHYENLLAVQWVSLDRDRPVWIEAESSRVGLCRVPDEIFLRMVESPVVQIERSRSERIAILLEVYGSADPEELIAATQRISKKLGGQNAQAAITHIREGNLAPAIETVLDYYDKSYLYDLMKREVAIYPIDVSGLSIRESVDRLIDKSREILSEKQVSAQELVINRK